MEEVWASDKERIDVVIFLNGLAIIAFELKCNAAGHLIKMQFISSEPIVALKHVFLCSKQVRW